MTEIEVSEHFLERLAERGTAICPSELVARRAYERSAPLPPRPFGFDPDCRPSYDPESRAVLVRVDSVLVTALAPEHALERATRGPRHNE
jgi:hypothetical protein